MSVASFSTIRSFSILVIDDDGLFFAEIASAIGKFKDAINCCTSYEEITKNPNAFSDFNFDICIVDKHFQNKDRGVLLTNSVIERWPDAEVIILTKVGGGVFNRKTQEEIKPILKHKFFSNPKILRDEILAAMNRKDGVDPELIDSLRNEFVRLDSMSDSQTDEVALLEFSNAELWSVLQDVSEDINTRNDALAILVNDQDPKLMNFFVDKLGDEQPSIWQSLIVRAFENTSVSDEELRSQFKTKLLSIAKKYLNLADPNYENAAISAIRKFQSMADESEIMELTYFLDLNVVAGLADDHIQDVRQVALQGIFNAFQSAPPVDLQQDFLRAQRDAVFEIASDLIRGHTMAKPENAALAIDAVAALSVLCDERALECVKRLRLLGMDEWCEDTIEILKRANRRWHEHLNSPNILDSLVNLLE